MRKLLVATTFLCGWLMLAEGQAQAADTIKVTFKNGTDLKVTYFLNGGKGLETRLEPGASATFDMVVDAGVQPIVRIYQVSGQKKDFTVQNGGRYVFKIKDGEIINFFE